ncbi:MAG: efflux RND transporter periplasmic adaptor subunit [Limisphaerales bacterium]
MILKATGISSSAAVTKAAVRDLTRVLRVSGKLVPDRTKVRHIASEVRGRIEKVHWESIGQEVKGGDRLYTIYSPVLLEAERDYHLLFQQSQMSHSSKITAEHARLLRSMRSRLAGYGMTKEQISKLPNKPDDISTTDILSPANGVLVELAVKDGDRVQEGTHLMSVADVYHLWFEFDVYERDLAAVQVGQTIKVSIAGGQEFSTIISYINELIRINNRSSKARAVLRNPTLRREGARHRTLTIGSYAEGSIELQSNAKRSLPREAFLSSGAGYVVFVRSDEGFERRPVSIGFRGDQHWELAGVENDEEVVTNGSLLLESESRL